MKWIPAYSTGIGQVDEQHKMLFSMSDDFQQALLSGQGEGVYGELLESLQLYAKAHFRFEEGCMARHVCPAYDINKAAHAQFMTLLMQYVQRYEEGGYQRQDAESLMQEIDTWLVEHICKIDVQLRGVVPLA